MADTSISEKELLPAIRQLVSKVDLQTTGVKQFIQLLSKHLGMNVKPQKAFIKKTLMEIIEEMNQNDDDDEENNNSESGEDHDDDGHDDEDDDEEDEDTTSRKKKQSNRGGGGGLAVKKEISDALAAFLKCGKEMSRTEIVKKLWEYIREHDLQNPNNKREIMLDDAMQQVFGCKSFTMFTMNKYIGAHIHPFKPVDLTTPATPTKKPSKRKANEKSSEKKKKKKRAAGTQPPYQLSAELEQVVGKSALPRPQVVSAIWEYIKANNLQNPEDKREILCDDKLKAVMKRDKVSMFKMNQLITPHLLEKVERTSSTQQSYDNQSDDEDEE